MNPDARPRRWSASARWGAALVGTLGLVAVFGPYLVTASPITSDFGFGVDGNGLPVGPCSVHWLGTDRLFRDHLARLVYSTRSSLFMALAATGLTSLLGGGAGVVSGYFEGSWLDTLVMGLVDVGQAFPFLLLVLALAGLVEDTTPGTLIGILGLTGWLGLARVVRSQTLTVRRLDFVHAARALGESDLRILCRHVVPNILGTLVPLSTLAMAQMILAESALSWLGVGLAPPTPTWGRMLLEGQDIFPAAPWLVVCPALAIVVTVLGFHLLGEAIGHASPPSKP